ncbi:MAG: N-acetylmuramoyl-L-alanine amidase, partial [Candidatus Gastranaerophilaceae bacterium]
YYKDDSLELAKYIHKSIMSGINENNRGVLKSRFYVIRHTNTPAVLLELGFISNEQERELLKDKQRQKKMAELITEGIINYLNNTGSSK